MAKKRKQYDDDDGRVIADMNVDGMPWYTPKKDAAPEGGESPQLSGHETWAMIWGVLKAALLIAGVFALIYFLLILALDLGWAK